MAILLESLVASAGRWRELRKGWPEEDTRSILISQSLIIILACIPREGVGPRHLTYLILFSSVNGLRKRVFSPFHRAEN